LTCYSGTEIQEPRIKCGRTQAKTNTVVASDPMKCLTIVTRSVGRSVHRSVTVVSPTKTAEPIEMPFGLWTRMGPRKHVLHGVAIGATWRIRLNRACAAAMRPFCHFYSARNARIASAVLATAIPSVRPSVSVCLSVRHTPVLCQNDGT